MEPGRQAFGGAEDWAVSSSGAVAVSARPPLDAQEAWTTNRPYPRQYFFNDHPNAGVRSFDYVYSLIGVVTGAFYACMLVCLVPMQLKALCSGGDPSGGIQAEI